MKKILGLILGLFLIMQFCFAQTNLSKTYVLTNDTAQEVTTNVSTATLVPNQTRILSFTVASSRSMSFSPYAALYDEADITAHSLNNLLGESEATANTTGNKYFPYPKNLSNGLTIVLGPYTAIILEYSK